MIEYSLLYDIDLNRIILYYVLLYYKRIYNITLQYVNCIIV